MGGGPVLGESAGYVCLAGIVLVIAIFYIRFFISIKKLRALKTLHKRKQQHLRLAFYSLVSGLLAIPLSFLGLAFGGPILFVVVFILCVISFLYSVHHAIEYLEARRLENEISRRDIT